MVKKKTNPGDKRRWILMQARMTNPAMIVPEAMQALQALGKSAEQLGVRSPTLGLTAPAREPDQWLQRLR
jgi:hypothetical protein